MGGQHTQVECIESKNGDQPLIFLSQTPLAPAIPFSLAVGAEVIGAAVLARRDVFAAALVRTLLRRCDAGALVALADGHVLVAVAAARRRSASCLAACQVRRRLRVGAALVAGRLGAARDHVGAAVPLAPASTNASIRVRWCWLIRKRCRWRRRRAW